MKKTVFIDRKRKPSAREKVERVWDRLRQPDYRAFFEFMIWPMLAVFIIGLSSYSILLPAYKGEWLILFSLLFFGTFLSIPTAAVIGSITFITYSIWLFYTQLDDNLTASHFILLAFMPFTPILLSATRLKVLDVIHLATLLELPQVRAAMNISDWSLLPSNRALELRLRQHIEENKGTDIPAIIVRFRFQGLEKSIELLGESVVLHEVKAMADNLRTRLRSGDMIAESIEDHSALYVLAFPNPKSDYLHAILHHLYPVMEDLEFQCEMDMAIAPRDGDALFNITWHEVKDGEVE